MAECRRDQRPSALGPAPADLHAGNLQPVRVDHRPPPADQRPVRWTGRPAPRRLRVNSGVPLSTKSRQAHSALLHVALRMSAATLPSVHRAGDEEVRHGQEPPDLALRPRLRLCATAARTRAVVARVEAEVFFAAVGAAVALPAQRGRAATPDRVQGATLLRAQIAPAQRRGSLPRQPIRQWPLATARLASILRSRRRGAAVQWPRQRKRSRRLGEHGHADCARSSVTWGRAPPRPAVRGCRAATAARWPRGRRPR